MDFLSNGWALLLEALITAKIAIYSLFQGYSGQLIEGAQVTVKLAVCSLILGLLFGLLGALAKRSPYKVLQKLTGAYVIIIRGVPELLIILLFYFGISILLRNIAQLYNPDVGYIEINSFAAGVFALALVFGAYATEVFRGALQSIPKGQIEAGLALGMSKFQIIYRILVPQVWRYALPGLGNLWLILLKETSLVSVIELDEIMRKAKISAAATHEPFKFYMVAAMMYLLLTAISMMVLHRMERKANKGVRQA